MQAIAKARARESAFLPLFRSRVAGRGSRRVARVIRTDFGMVHGEFQHGPLGGMIDNGVILQSLTDVGIRITELRIG